MSGLRAHLAAPAAGVVMVGLGVVLGAAAADAVGFRFVAPEPLDGALWEVISPGTVLGRDLGRGTFIADRALTLTEHPFYTADLVSPANNPVVTGLTVELAPDSGPLQVRIKGRDGVVEVALAPDHWMARPPNGERVAVTGAPTFTLSEAGGRTWLEQGEQRVEVGRATRGQLELTVREATARVRAITVRGEGPKPLVDQRFDGDLVPWNTLRAGMALGAAAGLAAWLVLTGGGGALGLAVLGLLLTLPLAVTRVTPARWLDLTERLYVGVGPWVVADWALLLALLPALTFALAHAGLGLEPRGGDRRLGVAAWALALGATALLAPPHADGLLPAVVGLALLAALPLLAWRAGAGLPGALLRDLPALAAVASLGWGVGLALALAWRLAVLAASAGALRTAAPRTAVNALLLHLLALPAAAEWAARDTPVGERWRPERLNLELATAGETLHSKPGWTGVCGEGEPARVVVFAGGSSTGGIKKLDGARDTYFAGRTHGELCEGRAGRLTTHNVARGAIDTHAIARQADVVLDLRPDVVVLYVGVNDLLSRFGTRTRRQREALLDGGGSGAAGLRGLAAHSRLLVGAGLALRQETVAAADRVPNVPVADAALNLAAFIEQAAAKDVRVLLVTEYVRERVLEDQPDIGQDFEAYAAMQRALAAAHENARYLDVRPALLAGDDDALLVDSNHLTAAGHEAIAVQLAPVVRELLEL